jgi:ribosomal protein S18 acetylase RimI-like enzyme
MRLTEGQFTGDLLRELHELNNSCFCEAEQPSFGVFEFNATTYDTFVPSIYSPRGLAIVILKQGEPHLWTLAVGEDFRRLGYAQELLDEVHGNFPEITLNTRIDNTPAQMLYLKNGYRIEKVSRGYYPNNVDGVFMRRGVRGGKYDKD